MSATLTSVDTLAEPEATGAVSKLYGSLARVPRSPFSLEAVDLLCRVGVGTDVISILAVACRDHNGDNKPRELRGRHR